MQDEGPPAKRQCGAETAPHVWPVVPSYYGLARWFPRDVRKLIYSQLTWEEQAVAHIAHGYDQCVGVNKDSALFQFAAEHGYTSLLRWLYSYFKIGWAKAENDMCVFAARIGQLTSLQWLRALNPPCPWRQEVCTYAAGEGHLELLQWSMANGCPRSLAEMQIFAERYFRVNVIKWLLTQECSTADVKEMLATLRRE